MPRASKDGGSRKAPSGPDLMERARANKTFADAAENGNGGTHFDAFMATFHPEFFAEHPAAYLRARLDIDEKNRRRGR